MVVFCPTKKVLVRELKSIPGQLHIPHATHHCFENENSQPIIAHFDEDKNIHCHNGGICVHIQLLKICCKYTIIHTVDKHSNHVISSLTLWVNKIKALDKNSPPPPPPPFIFCTWSPMVCIFFCTKVTFLHPRSNFASKTDYAF